MPPERMRLDESPAALVPHPEVQQQQGGAAQLRLLRHTDDEFRSQLTGEGVSTRDGLAAGRELKAAAQGAGRAGPGWHSGARLCVRTLQHRAAGTRN